MRKIARLIKRHAGIIAVGAVMAASGTPVCAAATADTQITGKVDDAKATFDAVLVAGLTITASMIGWGFLKRVRKG